MNFNRILSIFIIFSLFVIGCKKENDEDPMVHGLMYAIFTDKPLSK